MFLGVINIWILSLSQVHSTQPCGQPTSCSSAMHIQHDPLPALPHVPTLPPCITRVLFLRKIGSIQDKAFVEHPQLERVEFIGTSTATIRPAAFDGVDNLKFLEISGTKLDSLPDGIFRNLGQLVTLYLTESKIQSVGTKVFSGLGKLRDLRLACNRIDSTSAGALDDLKQLQDLDLSRNSLAAFPPKLFSHLTNLQRLRASQNQLDTIPQDIWSGDLTSLEEIELRGNKIARLQTPSGAHKKLERLFLGNNLLTDLPKQVFIHFPALKILDLQNNNISSFPQGLFSKLTQLELLDISNNKIEDLTQESFEGLGKLKDLNLERNLIHSLQEETFKHLQSLKSLNLSKNKLKSLTGVLFKVFGQLQVLLDGNPWHCDCEMKENIDSGNYAFIIECLSPTEVKNQSLSSLDKHLLCPTTTPPPSPATTTPASNSPPAPNYPPARSPASNSPPASNYPPARSPASNSPPASNCDGLTKESVVSRTTMEPQASGAEGPNWSSVSRVVVPIVAPLLVLLLLFGLARLYTRTRGYTVRPVDPRLKPVQQVDEENCKLLYVHDLQETSLPPQQPRPVSS